MVTLLKKKFYRNFRLWFGVKRVNLSSQTTFSFVLKTKGTFSPVFMLTAVIILEPLQEKMAQGQGRVKTLAQQ